MDDLVMNNHELALARKLGKAMGYKEDELAHPYREGKPWAGEGGQYMELHDFNPARDPADAMRVQVFFNLSMEIDHDVVVVREAHGPLLMIYTVDDVSPEGRVVAACMALCNAAAIQLSRTEQKIIAAGEMV